MAHHDHQFSLYRMQQLLPLILGRQHGTHDAYYGIQFVQTTVGLDADVVFRHPLSSMNTGHSLVTGLCINPFHSSFLNNLFKSISPQYKWV